MEVPVARVLRDFRGLPSDSLVSRTSSREKLIEIFFFSNFFSKVFGGLPWRLAGDLTQSQKTRVLRFKVSF